MFNCPPFVFNFFLDSRLVSSASTFGKMRSGTLTDLRINDKTSTGYVSTLTKGDRNSPQFAGLPPKPPGRASTYRRETNWSRRNASHVPFGRFVMFSQEVCQLK